MLASAAKNFSLEIFALNQVEIQPEDSMDGLAVARQKALDAFAAVGRPVLVEDVQAGLHKLNLFPGVYIKGAEQTMGSEALWILAGREEAKAYVTCLTAYFDGKNFLSAEGTQQGKVVAPRTEEGWGFDRVFVPEESTLTFGQMDEHDEAKGAYRRRAIVELWSKISTL